MIVTVGSLTNINETILSLILFGGLFLILTKYIRLYNAENGIPSKESVNKMITDLIIILGLFLLAVFVGIKGDDWKNYRDGAKSIIGRYYLPIGVILSFYMIYKIIIYLS